MTDLTTIDTRDLLAELDRRARAAAPPTVLFYGVWPGTGAGHYVRADDRSSRNERELERYLETLVRARGANQYLYPWIDTSWRDRRAQEEGKLWHWHHPDEPLTLLLSWDRSEDHRYGCAATFAVLALVSAEEALRLAREAFPTVFARIEKHLGRPVELAGPVEA